MNEKLQRERMKKLAVRIEALTLKDQKVIDRTHEIEKIRRQAAIELYQVCADFIARINNLLPDNPLILDPPSFTEDSFRDNGPNLLQINVRGRMLQIEIEATETLTSTEDFRVPYTLQGAVRSFNQALLDRATIEEQLLFYTLERARDPRMWRFFDARTYRTGPFDQEYLLSLMEQLV